MGGGPLYNFNNNNSIPMTERYPVVPPIIPQPQPQLQQVQPPQSPFSFSVSSQQEQEQDSIPATQLYVDLAEQSKLRQQYNKRSNYNPFLNQQPTSWSNNNSVASVYPSYDPNDFQVDPVPLTSTAPELPPVPAAYRRKTMPTARNDSVTMATNSNTMPTNSNTMPARDHSVTMATTPTSPQQPIEAAEQPINSPIPSMTTTNNKVRLIYTKSGFYLKSEDNSSSIHGFLAIFSKSMENVDILIAWIPEYLIEPQDIAMFVQLDGILASDQGFPTIDLNLGEDAMTINLKNIYSLYICPPSLQAQGSIVITTRSGDVFKPIWYSSSGAGEQVIEELLEEDKRTWPGYDIIDILSAFTPLKSSAYTQNVHLVESTTTTEQQQQPSPKPETSSKPAQEQHPETSDPIVKALRDARWTLLERLSRITQYSKDTAASVFQTPMVRPILPLLPDSAVQALGGISTVVQEYQMASHYLARWGTGSASEEYHLVDDTDGLLHGMPELCGPTPIHTRRSCISPEEWITLFDEEGKLDVPVSKVNELIFQGGLDSDIRIEAWKFLLGIYPWHSNFDEREAIRRSRAEAYYAIKSTWFDSEEVRNTKEFQDEKHRVDKDVHRTDRNQEAFLGDDLPNPDPLMAVGTNHNLEIMKDILVTYNFHNTDLGYVQGMSDLLAPLFVAMGDEPMAFWGFSLFMDRVQSNFFMDQTGMHGQLKTLDSLIRFMDPVLYQRLEITETNNLFFCFRWLLVWFKREFEWEDVIRLWEVLWTNNLSDKFILFVALAVIDAHRKTILQDLTQFDEVLRYVNDLTGNIPLEPTLERAEVLFYQFERKIRAMQHKKSMLQDQLQIRSVWNSDERPKIQERIEKLQIPNNLLSLLDVEKE